MAATFEVSLPAASDGSPQTSRVRAESWIAAVRAALGDLGETLGPNVLCDLQGDGTVRVMDPQARRAYRVRRCASEDLDDDSIVTWDDPPGGREASGIERAVQSDVIELSAVERAAMAQAVSSIARDGRGPDDGPEPASRFDLQTETFDDLLGTVLDELGWVYRHGSEQGLDQVAARALDLAMRLVPSESGAVLFASLGVRDLFFAAARGPKAHEVLGKRVPLARGLASFCVREGVAIAVPDVIDDNRHYHELAAAIGHIPRNIACAPLKFGDHVFGAIELLDKLDETQFTSVDVALLTHVGSQLAHWIHLQM